MSTTPRTDIPLPPPIAHYFASDAADADTFASRFLEDAVVVDEQRTYQGRAAIARWKADATAKYHYTSEPLSLEVGEGDTVVTARVTGDFPGSPVTLRYRFRLEGDVIARLEITE